MSSKKSTNVVSLEERRAQAGEAFCFEFLEEPEVNVGSTENEVVWLPGDGLNGFAFSAEKARKLGIALIEAAHYLDLINGNLVKPTENS